MKTTSSCFTWRYEKRPTFELTLITCQCCLTTCTNIVHTSGNGWPAKLLCNVSCIRRACCIDTDMLWLLHTDMLWLLHTDMLWLLHTDMLWLLHTDMLWLLQSFAVCNTKKVTHQQRDHFHHTTSILRPFFWDHPGEPVPEENFWAVWCKGRLTEADTLTIRLD